MLPTMFVNKDYHMVLWAHTSPHSKRHLDRIIRFAGLAAVSDIERQTDHETLCSDMPYFIYAMRAL